MINEVVGSDGGNQLEPTILDASAKKEVKEIGGDLYNSGVVSAGEVKTGEAITPPSTPGISRENIITKQ